MYLLFKRKYARLLKYSGKNTYFILKYKFKKLDNKRPI